jgi:hypothetical protein
VIFENVRKGYKYPQAFAYFFATHAELDVVNAKFDTMSNYFSHFIGPVSVCGDPSNEVTVPSSHLLAIR